MNEMNLNLLPSKAKFQKRKVELVGKTKVYMIAVSGVWCLVLVVVIILNIVVSVRKKTLERRYELVKTDYQGLAESVITSQNLKYRAKMIGGVIASRFEYSKAFKALKLLLPNGISMSDFKMTKKGVFDIKALANDGTSVDEFEKLVFEINKGNNEFFNKAKIIDVMVKNGVWNLEMEVSMK